VASILREDFSWQMTRISVIVPTLNEEKYLRQTLRSLAEQSFRNFELIVKDGVSQDNTVEIAKEFADLVLSEKDVSIGDARNQGAKRAKGDVLAFLDADTFLDKDALEIVAEDFALYDITLLLPKYSPIEHDVSVVPKIEREMNRFFVGFENYWRKHADKFCAGMFMPVSSAAFRRVGGFNRRVRCIEDIELSYRLRRIGNVLNDYRAKAYFSFRRFILSGYIGTLCNYGLNTLRMHLKLTQPEFESFR
jgi:glycosyltransferase involved in cell wall biosynthesis